MSIKWKENHFGIEQSGFGSETNCEILVGRFLYNYIRPLLILFE